MEKEIAYTVSNVTVFPDRAQVTCEGTVEVTPEVTSLLFEELPISMETDSVRVRGSGDVAVRILSVDIVRRHYEQSPASEIVALEDEIASVEGELAELEDEHAIWQAEADALDALRKAADEYAKGLARGRITPDEQQSLLISLRTQDKVVRAELRALVAAQRKLQRRLEKLTDELAELRSALVRKRYVVLVNVSVGGEGQFRPQLTYIVRGAQWRPRYDVHFEGSEGRSGSLVVTMQAEVTQRTGQTWNSVALTVSTARPALNQRVPKLDPWYVDEYAPQPPLPQSIPPQLKAAATLAADVERSVYENEEVVQAETASADSYVQQGFVVFTVEGLCTLSGDGSPHVFLLRQLDPEFELTYLAVPKHTDAIFRRLTVKNGSPAPLIPGPANLYVGGDYIGKTQLEYTPPEGSTELLLGIEERLTVKRELKKRTVDKRLLSDNRTLSFVYEIELQNFLQEEVHVELRDQLPVSRHEQIQVKLDEVDPAPIDRSELNILIWELKLDAREMILIRFGYTVQHPRSLQLAGLVD